MSTPEEVRSEFLTKVEDEGLTQQREFALQRASDMAAIRRIAAQIDTRNRRALRAAGEAAERAAQGNREFIEAWKGE